MQLTVEKLSKRYGRAVQALTNVDFTTGPGVVGLLGPNGAGKSTLMRIFGDDYAANVRQSHTEQR
jgi:ABC-2 type transport system ATP-binding protein